MVPISFIWQASVWWKGSLSPSPSLYLPRSLLPSSFPFPPLLSTSFLSLSFSPFLPRPLPTFFLFSFLSFPLPFPSTSSVGSTCLQGIWELPLLRERQMLSGFCQCLLLLPVLCFRHLREWTLTSFPDRLLSGAEGSLTLRVCTQAVITVMRRMGVNTPCDLRNDFSFCRSHMIRMNFNGLSLTALAWGQWLSELIFYKLTWGLKKLFVLPREVWILVFRSLGHAVILYRMRGNTKPLQSVEILKDQLGGGGDGPRRTATWSDRSHSRFLEVGSESALTQSYEHLARSLISPVHLSGEEVCLWESVILWGHLGDYKEMKILLSRS